MVKYYRQFKLVYTYIINIVLSYKYTLYIKVACTNYFASSLNIFAGKTLISNFSVPFARLSVDGKLYYNSSLFLNKSINLTSISL